MKNKIRFRILVFLMSFSLLGIIVVQLYWIDSSYHNNEDQFKYHITQVIGIVSEKLQQQEATEFVKKYNLLKDSIGTAPQKKDLKEYLFMERDPATNEQIIYSNTIVLEDYNLNRSFFEKNADSGKIKSFSAKRKTEVYSGNVMDNTSMKKNVLPDITIEKSGSMDILDRTTFDIYFKDIVALKPITDRISKERLQFLLDAELTNYGVKTPFEFAIYSNGLATKVKSENFFYDQNTTYSIPVFMDNENSSKFQLLVSFPNKSKYLFSSLIGITLLTLLFTLVIVVAYFSALHQLIKQKQISEIKSDFINNMTHEFKTPIATINLALDAIKNPKIFSDPEKVMKYLNMIKDENKRMHAQVDNVLQISKLERNEVDFEKQPFEVHSIIKDAVEHVNLIVEDRGGKIDVSLKANNSLALINNMHFTNVIVNILDNAIKYSPEEPQIEVSTENSKEFLFIKVRDHGQGMSKVALKRVFEKFYREHTGDIHNVKGHGLGLAYVKKIVDDHKGQIDVESEKGKGSTFTIKMPLIN